MFPESSVLLSVARASTEEAVNAEALRHRKIIFTPGTYFKNMLSEVNIQKLEIPKTDETGGAPDCLENWLCPLIPTGLLCFNILTLVNLSQISGVTINFHYFSTLLLLPLKYENLTYPHLFRCILHLPHKSNRKINKGIKYTVMKLQNIFALIVTCKSESELCDIHNSESYFFLFWNKADYQLGWFYREKSGRF